MRKIHLRCLGEDLATAELLPSDRPAGRWSGRYLSKSQHQAGAPKWRYRQIADLAPSIGWMMIARSFAFWIDDGAPREASHGPLLFAAGGFTRSAIALYEAGAEARFIQVDPQD